MGNVDAASALSLLSRGGVGAEVVAERVSENPELLDDLFTGLSSKEPAEKFGSVKVLRILSEKKPEMLYGRFDVFAGLLDSENSIIKWNAIDILANLASVDSRGEFNKIYEKFYGLLRSGSLITAAHVVEGSRKIASFKPELRDTITEELLKVETLPLPTEECRNILIGETIEALRTIYDDIDSKNAVITFVKRQLGNARNATRTRAEKFLKKRDDAHRKS